MTRTQMPVLQLPVHELPAQDGHTVRVERITPAVKDVKNSVHRHSYHELFFFARGSGSHMIDLETVLVRPPCLHLVAPGQVHKLDRSADCEGVVVLFGTHMRHPILSDPHVRSFLRCGTARPAHDLDQNTLKVAMSMAAEIERENEEQDACTTDLQENLLAVLLLKCLRWCKAGSMPMPPADPADMVNRFLEKVDREFIHKKQVSAYADDLALSPGHLNLLVKKRLGRNASEVIQDRLLLEARRLLLHGDLGVKEVSHALEMADPAYFTRWFSKASGMSPTTFRRQIREKYR